MHTTRSQRLLMAVVAMVCLAGCPSDQPEEETISKLPVIVAGVVNDAPGFSMGDLNPTGFDINIMNAVGTDLKTPITPTFLTSRERQAYLEQRKATIVIATYSITSKRNQDGIDFAGPYMVSPQALIVRADDNSMPDKDALRNKSICTVATTTGSKVNIPGANMDTQRNTTRQCIQLLEDRGTDAVFTDTLILYGYTYANPGKFKVIMSGSFGELQYYGIGLLRGRHADCLRLNEVIKKYLASQWRQDFQTTLKDAVEAHRGNDTSEGDFESVFKPKDTDIASLSCKL